jgi:BMFP domain-containing protein YqiC
MKNAALVICTILGTLLVSGCNPAQKQEENAFVTVTGHDLEKLSRRITALEARMQETQRLLVRAQSERDELRARLQALEARLKVTTAGAQANASQPAAAPSATARPKNDH